MVPTALVQRVELLTGGASSVYGADAVGGVVNFIIDKKFEGVKINGGYSFYNHKNDDSASQEVRRGRRLSTFRTARSTPATTRRSRSRSARTSATTAATRRSTPTYRDTDAVLQGTLRLQLLHVLLGRRIHLRWLEHVLPGALPSGQSDDAAAALTSRTTRDGRRTVNFGARHSAPAYNFGPLNYYQRPNQRYTGGTFLNFQLNEKAEVYGEFMFLKDQSISQIAPSRHLHCRRTTVSCANPLWSAGAVRRVLRPVRPRRGVTTPDRDVRRRNIEGGGRMQDLDHQSYRGGFGVKGDINEAWSYDASLFQGTSRISNTYLNDFSISRTGRALDVVPGPAGHRPAVRSSTATTRTAFRTTSGRPARSPRRARLRADPADLGR